LSPDVISILIGVNDVWHEARSGTGSTPARFQKSLRDLLEWTREELPSCQLVLCEPFGLPGAELSDESLADLRGRAAVVRAFAEEFEALFVPFQTMFDKACDEAPALYWLPDGVHPSPAGHARMADLWISVTRPIFCPE
jgi:lysophospholipase L1-like esterase